MEKEKKKQHRKCVFDITDTKLFFYDTIAKHAQINLE